jgi:hypothetical protein
VWAIKLSQGFIYVVNFPNTGTVVYNALLCYRGAVRNFVGVAKLSVKLE